MDNWALVTRSSQSHRIAKLGGHWVEPFYLMNEEAEDGAEKAHSEFTGWPRVLPTTAPHTWSFLGDLGPGMETSDSAEMRRALGCGDYWCV